MRHVDELTTKYLMRLLIGIYETPRAYRHYSPYPLDAWRRGLVVIRFGGVLLTPLVPAHPLAQTRDVGGVMPRVPGVEPQSPIEPERPQVRMVECTGEVNIRHRTAANPSSGVCNASSSVSETATGRVLESCSSAHFASL